MKWGLIALLPLILAGMMLLPCGMASAETLFELVASNQYQSLWSGYATVETCTSSKESIELGPYLFVCDQYEYAYPYHYGDTMLLGKQVELNGNKFYIFYLCMKGEDDCIKGSVYKR
ncbi:hypothetical protein SMD31_12000 [Dongia rigui]|uniref:DUF4359 domain-containing protein n=1 Tax=Dongia rigui TaxID=940149 RepID=A0ABU5E1G4_9PROT|nr:hypothetical protein [Dongia rigui]